MDSGIDELLVTPATKIATTLNVFGDMVMGAQTSTTCLFRDVRDMSASQQHRYAENIAGILWFSASEVIALGDLYQVNGEYFRVEHILKAQTRVTDNVLQFIKCAVSRTRQVS